MMRMLFRGQGLAGMTTGALAIMEAPGQGSACGIPIGLAMWLVAIHTRHRTVQVAIAIKMSRLVAKRFDTPILRKTVMKQRQFERKIIFQIDAREIRFFPNRILGGVTLKANLEGLIFGGSRKGCHSDIRV